MSTGNMGTFNFTKAPWLQNVYKRPKTLDHFIKELCTQNNEESTIFHWHEITSAHLLPCDCKSLAFVRKSF